MYQSQEHFSLELLSTLFSKVNQDLNPLSLIVKTIELYINLK